MLAWLLAEPGGEGARQALAEAERVIASDLTLVECDRALNRAHAVGRLLEAQAAQLRSRLNATATEWILLRLDADVVARARRPFPREPIRTLDALHLASALAARTGVGELALLSLDQRIRAAALELGFDVRPA